MRKTHIKVELVEQHGQAQISTTANGQKLRKLRVPSSAIESELLGLLRGALRGRAALPDPPAAAAAPKAVFTPTFAFRCRGTGHLRLGVRPYGKATVPPGVREPCPGCLDCEPEEFSQPAATTTATTTPASRPSIATAPTTTATRSWMSTTLERSLRQQLNAALDDGFFDCRRTPREIDAEVERRGVTRPADVAVKGWRVAMVRRFVQWFDTTAHGRKGARSYQVNGKAPRRRSHLPPDLSRDLKRVLLAMVADGFFDTERTVAATDLELAARGVCRPPAKEPRLWRRCLGHRLRDVEELERVGFGVTTRHRRAT